MRLVPAVRTLVAFLESGG
jgi:hypothetical protein